MIAWVVAAWAEAPEPPAEEEAYEVVVESFKPTAHPSRHVVDAEIAEQTPGALDDAVRLVQALPGVTVQREYTRSQGDLSIRGSSPGDNRYYLDGIEVPYLYHFGQYASVFPTSQLASLELYPSTFGAAYGDAIGGVVEARSDDRRPDALHGGASLNFVMAGADARAPIGPRAWVSVSARRSFLDAIERDNAQYTLWPRFGDGSARVGIDGDGTKTALFAYGAGDAYDRAAGELDLLDPVEQSRTATFAYRRAFEVVGARRVWDGDAVDGDAVAALVHDRRRGALSSGGAEDLRTVYLGARADLNGRPSAGFGWATGLEARLERTSLAVSPGGEDALVVADEAPALARGVAVDDTLHRARLGPYAEARLTTGALRVFPGLRLAIDSAGAPLRAEPRLAARLRVAPQTEVEAAAGRYHQSPDSEHLFPGSGDPGLATASAWQAEVGVEQTIARRLEVQGSVYGKSLRDVLVAPVGATPYTAPRGAAWGAELVTRYRLRERFFLWGWLSSSRSVVDDGGVRPADGDQPLAGGAVASWDPGRRWTLGLRYRYGSGLPYTPMVGSVYAAADDAWDPIAGGENSARMPAYHKVDANVAHTVPFRRGSLVLSAEIWYVPPIAAALYPTYSYDYREQGWVTGPALLPLLSARARF